MLVQDFLVDLEPLDMLANSTRESDPGSRLTSVSRNYGKPNHP